MATDTSRKKSGSAPAAASHPSELPSGEERYHLLLEAGQQLSSTLDADKVCERLRSLVSRAMPCDGIIVSSYDREEGLIRCEYALTGGEVLDASALPPLELGPPGSGMQSEVIRSGKSMRFGDVAKRVQDPGGTFMHVAPDGTVTDLPTSEELPTKCALMVPILLDGHVTGVVQVMTDQPAAYAEQHLELLEGKASSFLAPRSKTPSCLPRCKENWSNGRRRRRRSVKAKRNSDFWPKPARPTPGL